MNGYRIIQPFSIKSPRKSNLLIFDETGSEFVKAIIPEGFEYEIFKVRHFDFLFSVKVFIRFFMNIYLVFDHFIFNQEEKSRVKNFLRKLKGIYLKSCVDLIAPKALVSFIDNSTYLHFLCKHSKTYKVIGIQNGSRNAHNTDFGSFHLDYYFCFGKHERDLFKSHGARIKTFIPCGSLVADLNRRKNYNEKKNIDILVISGWRGNTDKTNYNGARETMKTMEKMDKLISRLVSEKKYSLAVALRMPKYSDEDYMQNWGYEKDYFRSIYGEDVELLDFYFDQNSRRRDIYKYIDKSRLSVSVLSTAIFEAYGLGEKALLCNFTGERKIYNWKPLLVTETEEYHQFSELVDEILNDEGYYEKHKNYSRYLMEFPHNQSVRKFISDNITKIIKKIIITD